MEDRGQMMSRVRVRLLCSTHRLSVSQLFGLLVYYFVDSRTFSEHRIRFIITAFHKRCTDRGLSSCRIRVVPREVEDGCVDGVEAWF